MEEKFEKIYKYIMIIVITAFITFLITSICVSNYYMGGKSDNVFVLNSSKSEVTLEAIEAIVDKYYLGEIDENKMQEALIKGYVEGLDDPYSEYITADEMEEYTAQVLGNFVGIGIYMIENEEYNLVQVLAPIPESPADDAGILPGDLIKSVDGINYTGDNMTVVANKIKGEEGTKVKLVIIRNDKELEFELTRRKVNTNPITEEILDNNIGYLEISSFDEGTGDDFEQKFKDLKSKGIQKLIIDLRNNGGGLVSEALQIADYIAEKGDTLLITLDKNDEEKVTKSENKPIVNMPIVILTNGNTASASEILAGALKDLNKATIVGTKTYGKGVIQQILKLTNGAGLKLTIQEYFTPNKNKINKVGIEPNEVVELPESVSNVFLLERKDDTQLEKAIEILKNQ